MVAGCASGLCNRLRMIAQWKQRCDQMRFLWPVNTACPAFFSDLFHPIAGVNCVRATSRQARQYRKPMIPGRAFTLLDLVPTWEIANIQEPYVAVHVRRTDIRTVLTKNKKLPVEDCEYFAFIESSGFDNVYLATDNQKTQALFKARYGSFLITSGEVQGFGCSYRPVRCTSVKHAVDDLYACIYASAFMGTHGSSFTGEILTARRKLWTGPA